MGINWTVNVNVELTTFISSYPPFPFLLHNHDSLHLPVSASFPLSLLIFLFSLRLSSVPLLPQSPALHVGLRQSSIDW